MPNVHLEFHVGIKGHAEGPALGLAHKIRDVQLVCLVEQCATISAELEHSYRIDLQLPRQARARIRRRPRGDPGYRHQLSRGERAKMACTILNSDCECTQAPHELFLGGLCLCC